MPSILSLYILNKSFEKDTVIIYHDVIRYEDIISNVKIIMSKNNSDFYSLIYGHYNYYILIRNNSIYIAISDIEYSTRVLKIAVNEYITTFETTKSKITAKKSLDKYKNSEVVDAISKVKNKVEITKKVMSDNIKISLENHAKIENIEEATEELMKQAVDFKDNSKKIRLLQYWKNIRMKVLLGSFILIVLFTIIISSLCSSGLCKK